MQYFSGNSRKIADGRTRRNNKERNKMVRSKLSVMKCMCGHDQREHDKETTACKGSPMMPCGCPEFIYGVFKEEGRV